VRKRERDCVCMCVCVCIFVSMPLCMGRLLHHEPHSHLLPCLCSRAMLEARGNTSALCLHNAISQGVHDEEFALRAITDPPLTFKVRCPLSLSNALKRSHSRTRDPLCVLLCTLLCTLLSSHTDKPFCILQFYGHRPLFTNLAPHTYTYTHTHTHTRYRSF
jgi:hypothetical protein